MTEKVKENELDIINEIDLEIQEIKDDTNRGITKLSKLLIWLAKLYAEYRSMYVKNKVAYNLKSPELKERIRKEAGDKKITVAQIDTLADLELIDILIFKGEAEEMVAYIEPLLEAYNNYINSIKHDDKMQISDEHLYKNNLW